MSEIVIKIENLSKIYRIGQIGTGTISHDLNRYWARIRGKEDPYSEVGQINDRSKEAYSEYVYAIKDINLEVNKGEIVGVIGKNGAGKSTLLKLISQITSPSSGSIKLKGRIASLLEVGTGMHAEMTARENIYLNGAILGMSKNEIDSKFDEIIRFAGCAMYVDTPIKRFSSGMSVRLGFAVAAHLESDILIVDEVLAVGDAEFQKKAIGKIRQITNGQGKTVLFVSHNMSSILKLCNKGVVMDKGGVVFSGDVIDSISFYKKYYSLIESSKLLSFSSKYGNLTLKSFKSTDKEMYSKNLFVSGEDIYFHLEIDKGLSDNVILAQELYLSIMIKNELDERITTISSLLINNGFYCKEGYVEAVLKNNNLTMGRYIVDIGIYIKKIISEPVLMLSNITDFEIIIGGNPYNSGIEQKKGVDKVICDFEINAK